MRACAERNVAILQEVRYVASEVGYTAAYRMSREVRQWWITQMQKDRQSEVDELERRSGKKRVDV